MLKLKDTINKLHGEELIEFSRSIESLMNNAAWKALAEELKRVSSFTRNDLKPIYIDPDCGDALGNIVAQNIKQNAKLDKSLAFDSVLQWLQDAKAHCDKRLK